MEVQFSAKGIHLPEIGLWLDPAAPAETAWLSHGHSDHARGLHGKVIGTPETLEIYRIRQPVPEGEPAPEAVALKHYQVVELGGARLTALPAGHIVGAAQILIEFEGERLVYTGDLKVAPPICGSVTEIVPCERLIIESTFGLPIYRFLGREEARQRIVQFAEECLSHSELPVFLGYPLGRGQEIAHVLCEAGIPTAVHGAIAKFIPVYERAGYGFPGWEQYDALDGSLRAQVVVPGMRKVIEARGRSHRVAYVSGWAALDNARARSGADVLIPYSDHASFPELLDYIERSGAKEIDVVHGYTTQFARLLAMKGLTARAPLVDTARATAEDPEG